MSDSHPPMINCRRLSVAPADHQPGLSFWSAATGHEPSIQELSDPAGLVSCVVGIQTGEAFDTYATTWP